MPASNRKAPASQEDTSRSKPRRTVLVVIVRSPLPFGIAMGRRSGETSAPNCRPRQRNRAPGPGCLGWYLNGGPCGVHHDRGASLAYTEVWRAICVVSTNTTGRLQRLGLALGNDLRWSCACSHAASYICVKHNRLRHVSWRFVTLSQMQRAKISDRKVRR